MIMTRNKALVGVNVNVSFAVIMIIFTRMK